MHGFDYLVPLFSTRVRGTCSVVTLQLVADVLCVSRVKHYDYPGCEHLRTVSKDKMIFAFCKRLLIRVIFSLQHVRPLLKVLDSGTW